jgi:hypothetical protein
VGAAGILQETKYPAHCSAIRCSERTMRQCLAHGRAPSIHLHARGPRGHSTLGESPHARHRALASVVDDAAHNAKKAGALPPRCWSCSGTACSSREELPAISGAHQAQTAVVAGAYLRIGEDGPQHHATAQTDPFVRRILTANRGKDTTNMPTFRLTNRRLAPTSRSSRWQRHPGGLPRPRHGRRHPRVHPGQRDEPHDEELTYPSTAPLSDRDVGRLLDCRSRQRARCTRAQRTRARQVVATLNRSAIAWSTCSPARSKRDSKHRIRGRSGTRPCRSLAPR